MFSQGFRPKKCEGLETKEFECAKDACDMKWSEWSSCSAYCGRGSRRRKTMCSLSSGGKSKLCKEFGLVEQDFEHIQDCNTWNRETCPKYVHLNINNTLCFRHYKIFCTIPLKPLIIIYFSSKSLWRICLHGYGILCWYKLQWRSSNELCLPAGQGNEWRRGWMHNSFAYYTHPETSTIFSPSRQNGNYCGKINSTLT